MASANIGRHRTRFSHTPDEIRAKYNDQSTCQSLIGAFIQFFGITDCDKLRRSYAIRLNDEGEIITNEITPQEGEFYRITYMSIERDRGDIILYCDPIKPRNYPCCIRWVFNITQCGTGCSFGRFVDDVFERCNIFTHWHHTIHHLLPEETQHYISTICLSINRITPKIDPLLVENILEHMSLDELF